MDDIEDFFDAWSSGQRSGNLWSAHSTCLTVRNIEPHIHEYLLCINACLYDLYVSSCMMLYEMTHIFSLKPHPASLAAHESRYGRLTPRTEGYPRQRLKGMKPTFESATDELATALLWPRPDFSDFTTPKQAMTGMILSSKSNCETCRCGRFATWIGGFDGQVHKMPRHRPQPKRPVSA